MIIIMLMKIIKEATIIHTLLCIIMLLLCTLFYKFLAIFSCHLLLIVVNIHCVLISKIILLTV